MGKKRRIIAKPQKFGKKHINHPLVKAGLSPEEVEEVVIEPKSPPVVEEVKPEPKPEPKKVEVKKEEPRKRKRKTPLVTKKTKPSDD